MYTPYVHMVGGWGNYSGVNVLSGRGVARTIHELFFLNNSNIGDDVTWWGPHGHDVLMMLIGGLLTIASSELQVNALGGRGSRSQTG